MLHANLRTPSEVFDDILSGEDLDTTGKVGNKLGMIASAEDLFDRAAAQLGWTWGQTRRHYLKICEQLGVEPDEEGS